MRRLFDHLSYYWSKLAERVQSLSLNVLNVLSFFSIFLYFGYIVYYSTICYHPSKVVTGCLSLWIMIHLNKSL